MTKQPVGISLQPELFSQRSVRAATVALAAIAMLGVACYIALTYRAFLSSDAAVANILAGEIVRSGHFFPPDFWYVNQDLWIFFKHLLVLPWAAAGHNGYAAHAFAVAVSTTLLVISAYALLKRLGGCRYHALWAPILLCIGYSDHYLDMLFGEAAYTWTLLALLWFLLLVVQPRQADSPRDALTRALLLAGLVVLFATANPTRFATFIGVPVAAALMLAGDAPISWLRTGDRSGRAIAVAAAATALVMAALLHQWLLVGLSNIQGASAAELVPLEQLPITLGYGIGGLLRVLGVHWAEGTRLGTVDGLLMLIRLFAALTVLAIPVVTILKSRPLLTYADRVVSYTALGGLAFVGLLVATTNLQGGNAVAAIYTSRYVVPYLALLLVAAAWLWPRYTRARRVAFAAAMIALASGSWSHISPTFREQDMLPNAASAGYVFEPGWRSKAEKTRRVINALEAQGLKYGYAPYWHSYPYTVLSNGALEIRPIHLNGGQPLPWLHLSSSRWYRSGYADRGAFLLVPQDEVTKVEGGLLDSCGDKPTRSLRVEDYTVYIYDRNPLLSVASENLSGTGAVCLNQRSSHQVGRFDAATGSLRASPAEGAGLLHYGPYQMLDRGSYEVAFTLRVDGGPAAVQEDLGYVEATGNSGKVQLARAPIGPGTSRLTLPVRIQGHLLKEVEFRVYTTGRAGIELDRIQITRTAP